MKTSIAIIFMTALIAGCATSSIQEGLLSKPGVTLKTGSNGYKYLDVVTFHRVNAPTNDEQLPMCVAEEVPNEQFTLQGGNDGHFDWFTGTYRMHENMREVGSGSNKHFVSKDGKTVITKGTSSYSTRSLIPIKRGIVYTLSVKPSDNGVKYEFHDIKQAQLNTGGADNSGFYKVGAWSGAHPLNVYNGLKQVADSVNRCLSS